MRLRRLGLVLDVDRFMEARHTRDVPKAERERTPAGPPRPLADPMRTLGHAARPRKRRR